ncbi:MAG: hypothetical protein Q8R38_02850 [Candidatus Omnitrophota bacterium]|nr:hypothetical protein [Candidatus Omnitrophota bacterium]
MEGIKMVRHLEEVKGEEMNRDADIDPKEIDLLINYYVPAILEDIESGKYDRIVVISSDKLRSMRTADILKDEISKRVNIPIEQEIDPRTSSEIHGEYKRGVNIRNPLIKKAKFIFLQEAFEKGNIWYRYGSVTNDSDEKAYPELAEIFASPGESQAELNIRMYRFILDLLQKIEEEPKTLYILSAHHIVMSTLLSLMYIVDKAGAHISLLYHPLGEMYKDENKATEEMIGGWENFYNFYKTRNYIFDIDVSKLEQMRGTIQSELDIFLARYMQHYGKPI